MTGKRIQLLTFSEIVRIRDAISVLRERGLDVVELHGGEPCFEIVDEIKVAMEQAIAENRTRYAPSCGIAALRERIAQKLRKRNRIEAGQADVVVTSGGTQALFAAFQACAGAGDEVLVFSPYWTPIWNMVIWAGALPIALSIRDLRVRGIQDVLASAITTRTKALYVNTPHNPTGIVFTRDELAAVAETAIKHNLTVISDEAYEDLIYEGEHVSIASLPGMLERTISCYSFSKSYAMTGWRVGYAVAKNPSNVEIQKAVLYSSNGVTTPCQWAAVAALDTRSEILEARRGEYRRRRDRLVKGLEKVGYDVQSPQGAFYVFPSIKQIHYDASEAVRILLEQAGISSVPGTAFGEAGQGHIRLSFSVPMGAIDRAIELMQTNISGARASRESIEVEIH